MIQKLKRAADVLPSSKEEKIRRGLSRVQLQSKPCDDVIGIFSSNLAKLKHIVIKMKHYFVIVVSKLA